MCGLKWERHQAFKLNQEVVCCSGMKNKYKAVYLLLVEVNSFSPERGRFLHVQHREDPPPPLNSLPLNTQAFKKGNCPSDDFSSERERNSLISDKESAKSNMLRKRHPGSLVTAERKNAVLWPYRDLNDFINAGAFLSSSLHFTKCKNPWNLSLTHPNVYLHLKKK